MPRIDRIRKLLEAEPDDVLLNFSLAMEYQSSERPDDAVAQYKKTIALDGGYLAAYVQAGQVLLSERRHAEARAMLDSGAKVAQSANNTHILDKINEMLKLMP